VQGGGYEHTERLGICVAFQLAFLARHSDACLDSGIEGAKACGEDTSVLRIFRRLGCRVAARGTALVIYGGWRMLRYSPQMDWRFVIEAGVVQGAGLGILPALTKSAFGTIGITVVLTCSYGNTQAMHVALAKDLTPFRAAAHVAGSIATTRLASLNDMITGQAPLIAVIDQFSVVMIVMLIVAPLVLLLRRRHRRAPFFSLRGEWPVPLGRITARSRECTTAGGAKIASVQT